MRFYHATRFLFPRSYHLRIFVICFASVHLPLVAFLVAEAARGEWHLEIFMPLLLATLAGTVIAIAALGALLAPIRHATVLLSAVQAGKRVDAVPAGGKDLAGQLLAGVGMAAAATAARIDQLTDEAARDLLTGLFNRRGFIGAASIRLMAGRKAAVALLDLDYFRLVNERYGMAEGDRVLQDFGDCLTENLREADVVGRWGGEEFVVMMFDIAPDRARQALDRLRHRMRSSPLVMLDGEPLTFSCGLATVNDPDNLESAMRLADSALYTAKLAGRDQVRAAPVAE
ncbi:GGDEF domain-containing protein [Sphingomonas sanxanigenens]|nr:GGDEF domain-containing protein [Sphingomonas sanxanigenens]